MKKTLIIFIAILLTASLIIIASGCRTKEGRQAKKDTIELTYYRLYDNEEHLKPLIQEFQSQYRYIKINYRKFTDPEEYENLIINELAEGEGPDIFAIHNTWMPKHIKKLTPMPEDLMSTEVFQNTFVPIASDDLIITDDEGNKNIYGIPLGVDTLALYYNKNLYADKIPSRGKPPVTWDELKEDVYKLNKKDNSFERFEVAGIALGRSDNIIRATDILYVLMLQNKIQFYDEAYGQAIFASNKSAADALKLYTSFAIPTFKHYSWNAYLSDAKSEEKEIRTFAKGKVTMILGYSYLYEEILNQIEELKNKGISRIDKDDIAISPIPQINDPKNTNLSRDTYASYFAETVAHTSEHPREAWALLKFLSSKENIAYYNEKTHRGTSRRDLIEEQSKDPTYGVFAQQLGYARSIPMIDAVKYKEIFEQAIEEVLQGESTEKSMKKANMEINKLIPAKGVYHTKQ